MADECANSERSPKLLRKGIYCPHKVVYAWKNAIEKTIKMFLVSYRKSVPVAFLMGIFESLWQNPIVACIV